MYAAEASCASFTRSFWRTQRYDEISHFVMWEFGDMFLSLKG
jgi:hypothetical protein